MKKIELPPLPDPIECITMMEDSNSAQEADTTLPPVVLSLEVIQGQLPDATTMRHVVERMLTTTLMEASPEASSSCFKSLSLEFNLLRSRQYPTNPLAMAMGMPSVVEGVPNENESQSSQGDDNDNDLFRRHSRHLSLRGAQQDELAVVRFMQAEETEESDDMEYIVASVGGFATYVGDGGPPNASDMERYMTESLVKSGPYFPPEVKGFYYELNPDFDNLGTSNSNGNGNNNGNNGALSQEDLTTLDYGGPQPYDLDQIASGNGNGNDSGNGNGNAVASAEQQNVLEPQDNVKSSNMIKPVIIAGSSVGCLLLLVAGFAFWRRNKQQQVEASNTRRDHESGNENDNDSDSDDSGARMKKYDNTKKSKSRPFWLGGGGKKNSNHKNKKDETSASLGSGSITNCSENDDHDLLNPDRRGYTSFSDEYGAADKQGRAGAGGRGDAIRVGRDDCEGEDGAGNSTLGMDSLAYTASVAPSMKGRGGGFTDMIRASKINVLQTQLSKGNLSVAPEAFETTYQESSRSSRKKSFSFGSGKSKGHKSKENVVTEVTHTHSPASPRSSPPKNKTKTVSVVQQLFDDSHGVLTTAPSAYDDRTEASSQFFPDDFDIVHQHQVHVLNDPDPETLKRLSEGFALGAVSTSLLPQGGGHENNPYKQQKEEHEQQQEQQQKEQQLAAQKKQTQKEPNESSTTPARGAIAPSSRRKQKVLEGWKQRRTGSTGTTPAAGSESVSSSSTDGNSNSNSSSFSSEETPRPIGAGTRGTVNSPHHRHKTIHQKDDTHNQNNNHKSNAVSFRPHDSIINEKQQQAQARVRSGSPTSNLRHAQNNTSRYHYTTNDGSDVIEEEGEHYGREEDEDEDTLQDEEEQDFYSTARSTSPRQTQTRQMGQTTTNYTTPSSPPKKSGRRFLNDFKIN
jgi:hypothetical protein